MVLRTIGPRITGPWDLGCLGSKVRGPKVRGSKALGLIILEPSILVVDNSPVWFVSCVYSTVIDKIPLRAEGLSTLRAGEWSLASVLAHVHWGLSVDRDAVSQQMTSVIRVQR